MRIACVYVPDLALQAILRRDPEHRQDPVALCEAPGERARIIACNEAARRAGVRIDLLASQARSVASGHLGADRLRVLVAHEADTAAAAAALADVGFGFAPRVQRAGERIYFEIGELTQIYPQGETAIAQAIAVQAARLGLEVRVGIAGRLPIARAAAQASEIAVVPSGSERSFLEPLPIATLLVSGLPSILLRERSAATRSKRPARDTAAGKEMSPAELADLFVRWGLDTAGALAALPATEIALRLGRTGSYLHALASGVAEEPFSPELPPDALEEGTEIDYPIAELEPLAFLLRGVFDRALGRLTCRGLACAGFGLRLKLDPRGYDVRDIALSAPTREVGTLLDLVRLDLARRPPPEPIIGISILLLPARVRGSQMDLFRPAGPAPEKLAATLSRLESLVGSENVGSPALVDDFREEKVTMRPFAPPAAHLLPDPPPAPPPEIGLGFRRFRPPRPLEVLMDRDGPSALRAQDVTARVLVAAGPYRASGGWWTEESFSRDYWDVHASDGAVYRMHQDRASGTWFLDGYYD